MKKNQFPEDINGYRYWKPYKINTSSNTSNFCLYKNKRGKLAFAKMISTNKIWERYWLQNEITICPVINSIPDRKLKIYSPKILGSFIGENYSIILFAFLSGRTLNKFDLQTKLKTIDKVLSYFELINKSKELNRIKSKLTYRNNYYFISLFPLFFVKSLIKNELIRSLFWEVTHQYILSIVSMFNNSKIKFIHRDINGSNIIISKKNIFIIDFQSSLLADVRFEVANIAVNLWATNGFGKKFYNLKSVNKIIIDDTSLQIYKFYSLYASIFEISKRKNDIEPWLIQYLRHSMSLRINSKKEITYE